MVEIQTWWLLWELEEGALTSWPEMKQIFWKSYPESEIPHPRLLLNPLLTEQEGT